jgi:pyruvate formate lyase activating enzyme
MVRWIVDELGPDIPVHFSRFYPKYLLRNLPPTPVPTLVRLREIALEGGLNYVYLGNVPGHEAGNTVCPGCDEMLIQRVGYKIYRNDIREGSCKHCGQTIAGIWS